MKKTKTILSSLFFAMAAIATPQQPPCPGSWTTCFGTNIGNIGSPYFACSTRGPWSDPPIWKCCTYTVQNIYCQDGINVYAAKEGTWSHFVLDQQCYTIPGEYQYCDEY